MSESLTTTIDLLRHGQVEGGDYYRGQRDDPLTETGWQQMQDSLAGHNPWSRVVSSSLSRCSEFARELANRHQLSLELSDAFREINFGQWQGKTAAQLMESSAEDLKLYWQDPEQFTPPGAESVVEFRKRVIHQWNNMIEQSAGQHLLLVSHGGVMGVILSEILSIPASHLLRLEIPHASLSRVVVEHFHDEQHPRLVFHNGQL